MNHPKTPRLQRSQSRQSQLESLEPRRLMAAEVQLATHGLSETDASNEQVHPPGHPTHADPASRNSAPLADVRDWRFDSALIGGVIGGITASRSQEVSAGPSETGQVFPRGQSAPTAPAAPFPVGLFSDGSVRTVHPDIDPRVLMLLRRNGRAPIPWATHRPGIGYGAPSDSLAGIDPRLRVLIGMQMNWHAGVGPLLYSRYAITIRPNSHTMSRAQIQQWLSTFEQFSQGNIATATLVEASPLGPAELADHRYVLFHPRIITESHPADTLYGMLNSAQRLVNPSNVAVRLFTPADHSFLMGITLGNHMLVGARRWRVIDLPNGDLRVETDAWVRCNGELNQVALHYGGREMMNVVWSRYLANIGNAATEQGGSWRFTASHFSSHANIQTNPFRVLASRHKWVPMVFPEIPTYLSR